MATKPTHVVEPALFDSVAEYAAELEGGIKFKDHAVPKNSKILYFCEEFFRQFFENHLDEEITGFDDDAKEISVRIRKRAKKAEGVKLLLSQFEKFCDQYLDIVGAGYGGSPHLLREFHTQYVVRVLDRAQAFAKKVKDKELAGLRSD